MIGYILTCKENHLYSLTSRSFALSLPYKSVSRHINIFQSDPDFITSLVGWSVIIDYQLVISLFQQLMVTQLRIMEWYHSLARQAVNVFVLTHIALPSPDDTKQKIMYSLTLHEELWVSTIGIALRASSTAIPLIETHPFRGQSLYMKKIAKA